MTDDELVLNIYMWGAFIIGTVAWAVYEYRSN